jgi:hypothetical protein
MSARASIKAWIREPSAINAAQILQYSVGAFAGVMAVTRTASPQFLTSSLGPVLITTVGCILVTGCTLGVFSVLRGYWWLERIALIVVSVGFMALLPAAIYYSLNGTNSAIWLVLVLVVWALCDVFKRYRRIDWAYLDPSK